MSLLIDALKNATKEKLNVNLKETQNNQSSQNKLGKESNKYVANENSALKMNKAIVTDKTSTQDQTFTPTDLQLEETADVPTVSKEDTVQAVAISSKITNEYFNVAISSVELAEDIGADSPIPATAQTIFSTKSTASNNKILPWSILTILCLFIAVLLSVFVFIYTVPGEHIIKLPLAVKEVETQTEAMLIIETPEALIDDTNTDSHFFTGAITDVIEQENAHLLKDEDKPDTEVIMGDPSPEKAMVNKVMNNESTVAKANATEKKTEDPAEDYSSNDTVFVDGSIEPSPLPLPEKIMANIKLIKISRSKISNKENMLLNHAYEEFLAGNYVSAKKSYHRILKNLPENRDALWGLAVISLHQGDIHLAYRNYLEILRLYPRDSVAEAALINLKIGSNPPGAEGIIKRFLQREPENSFLYYTLARLYASQARWHKAQQSFFDAYRLDNSNAYYAFNLAVSLEHIGQNQAAIDYYKTALSLVNNTLTNFSIPSFDSAVVIARIDVLLASVNSK